MATIDSSYRSSSNSPSSFQLNGENSSTTSNVNAAINAASSRDRCRRCHQMVYVTERIGPVKDSLYHKLCFKCLKCDRQLDFKTYFTNSIDLTDKEIYCQSHVPRSGKGVFSTENIHIQNVMKAPKLNVMQKLDDRLKVRLFCFQMIFVDFLLDLSSDNSHWFSICCHCSCDESSADVSTRTRKSFGQS